MTPAPFLVAPAVKAAKRRWYPARVLEVVDTDSLELELDVGFFTTRRETVRLVAAGGQGVDAPDPGKDAPAAERELLARGTARVLELCPPEAWLGVWTTLVREGAKHAGRDARDGFRRYLAQVQLPDGRDLAAVLLEEKLVVDWRRRR